MSINIYVSEKIKQAEGFMAESGGGSAKFNGVTLYKDKGPLYAMLVNNNDPLPEFLVPFVELVSMHDHVSTARAHRETGIYSVDGAEAEVELVHNTETPDTYYIRAKGKMFQAVVDLVRKFKTGTIRPTDSFEGKTQGKSREDLERELEELKRRFTDHESFTQVLERRITRLTADLEIAQHRVKGAYRLAEKIGAARWPLCNAQDVSKRITAVLNAEPQSAPAV
jgi:hypothetical protein